MVVVRPVVALVGRQAGVVPAVHLAGRLVPCDRRVGVAVRLGPAVVEDAEVHRRDQAVRQVAELGQGLPDHDQARCVPAVVDVGDEVAVVECRRGLGGAIDVAGVSDHVAGGGVVPLVQESVEPPQVLHLGQRGLDQGGCLRPADQAEVLGRDHRPQVHPDIGGGGVSAVAGGRGGAAREGEVVHRQVRRRVDVRAVELPGISCDAEQGRLAARRSGRGNRRQRPPPPDARAGAGDSMQATTAMATGQRFTPPVATMSRFACLQTFLCRAITACVAGIRAPSRASRAADRSGYRTVNWPCRPPTELSPT